MMRILMSKWCRAIGYVLAVALLAAGCAASSAFREGDAATKMGNLDEAVAAYRKAVQAEPDNVNFKLALERAMAAASRMHLERAKQFEDQNQLEAALSEYRLASEYDPSNRAVLVKVAALDQTLRDRAEAARPKPAVQQLRERVQGTPAAPLLNPASREPLRITTNGSMKDVLNFISNATGINITYDRDVTDRTIQLALDGVTLEQALNQIMTSQQLSYKVINERSIFVFQDTAQKHAQYDEQVIRTFYLSNGDPTEVAQTLSTIIRIPGIAVQPAIVPSKTTNSITVRGTAAVVDILEKMISQNDKPRAEIVVDVSILEVDRSRAKSYGLNLSQYAIGGIFSPEVSPGATTTPGTGTGTPITAGRSTPPDQVVSPPPFNLNTISRGINTADFYLAVPTAIVRFLESDTHTKIMAKPQLRGAEGTKLSYSVGTQVPIVSTTYTPIATGGAGVNPLSSYTYKNTGVNIEMTPRVTLDGDIVLDILIDDSAVGPDKAVAGTTVPQFINRTVTTRLRLRDGEPNLLAGLVQQNDTNGIQGFPGAIHVPGFKQLLSGNTTSTDQTEIIMLLTPHIVRTTELTESDLRPVYIGSQQNLGIGGPPPLIAAPAEPAATPGAAPATPNPPGTALPGPGGTQVAPPPGSSPVPGTVVVPVNPGAPTPAPATPAQPAPQPQGAPQPAPQPSPSTAVPPAGAAPAAEPPITTTGVGSAQVIISPPTQGFRVGGGPYTVPLLILDASRISTVTLTLTFDPTKLRVRSIQEGSFMRTGGASVRFVQAVTPSSGRIDITISRAVDDTGASGTGLLAAVLFDAIDAGSVPLTLSGSATGPGGTPMGLQFRPITVNIER
jgi:general secretion pathway protein D